MKIKENSFFFLETAEMGTFALTRSMSAPATDIDVVITANMYASEL